jgi:shikimate dehydrogenase
MGCKITGRTRLLGVMGWPVEHSRSPAMHSAAIAAAGLDYAYVPLPVPPGRLHEAVRGLRALGFRGCNVTIPHKVAVAGMMDELTPAAKGIGAVNTILVQEPDGRLIGDNTDCEGAFDAIEDRLGVTPAGAEAAMACAWGAAARGARTVRLLNRTREKAEEIARSMAAQHPGCRFDVVGPDDRSAIAASNIVLQMTSLGMKPQDPLPLDPALLGPDAVVLEAVYSPLETAWLRACRERGLRAVDGLAMLVGQGALSFEKWTGARADRNAMVAALQTG